MKQKPWDEFETALLIEAYQKIRKDNANKDATLANLSNTLRQLAKKNGFEIDSTYRNVNGMYWQFGYIERAFKGEDFEQRHQAKIFADMVDMYKNDHDAFEKILNEAHDTISEKNNVVKNTFIRWLKNQKTGKTSPNNIADLIENTFSKCCDLYVWDITDSKLYDFLLKDIASNYKFKNSNRPVYKQFFEYAYFYSDFLKNNKIVNFQKEVSKISAALDASKYYEELEKIKLFFNDKNRADFFSNAFLYSKQQNPEIQLDVRSTIIGVILENERLRYYSDKKGIIKIKLSRKDRYTVSMSEIQIDSFYQLIDFSNKYLENNREEIIIGSPLKEQQEETDINSRCLTDDKNKTETYFNNYLKDEYSANHLNDGKAKRAPYHAQKCIAFIKQINVILHDNNINRTVFEIKDINEINDIIKFFKDNKKEFDESDYKWYSYILGMYRSFLKQNVDEFTTIKEAENSHKVVDGHINSDYIKIIEEFFPDGFSYSNPLRKKRFEQLYNQIYSKEFTDTEEEYIAKILCSGFESEGKIYPLSIVSDELKNRIREDIEKATSEDPGAIYYSSLFMMYKNELSDLFGKDMFMSYLMHVFQNEYSFEKSYFIKKDTVYDLKRSLIDYFTMNNRPTDIEDIYNRFPYISENAINEVIKTDDDFIINFKGKSYFYYGIFEITDEQLRIISDFIQDKITDEGQVSRSEIYEYVSNNLPMLLEANPGITDFGLRNILKRYLGEQFSFNGDVISSYGNQLDVKSLFKNYCKERETFTLTDLDEFKNSIHKSYIDYDAIFDVCIRIDKNNYVRKDLVEFDIKRIDKAISVYCKKGYTSFYDVVNYNDFPTQQYPWNEFLLESYVYSFSEKFHLLHTMFNRDKPVGAIVKNDTDINEFDELLERIISENKLYEKEKALDYLIENSFIMRRRLNEIDTIIEIARGKEM